MFEPSASATSKLFNGAGLIVTLAIRLVREHGADHASIRRPFGVLQAHPRRVDSPRVDFRRAFDRIEAASLPRIQIKSIDPDPSTL